MVPLGMDFLPAVGIRSSLAIDVVEMLLGGFDREIFRLPQFFDQPADQPVRCAPLRPAPLPPLQEQARHFQTGRRPIGPDRTHRPIRPKSPVASPVDRH